MPAAIALSAPYLSWWDREHPIECKPLITCDYAILPTGSMLQADQLMYGAIGSEAVPSEREAKLMVVRSERKIQLFPMTSADAERIMVFSEQLTIEFILMLNRHQLFEPSLVSE